MRDDALVGAVGVCGEAHVGLALVLSRDPWPRWRLLGELGVGFISGKSVGDGELGLAKAASGAYLAPRLTFGYDWNPLFFTEFGVQVRLTDSMSFVVAGVQPLVELGTRVFCRNVEIGIRETVGTEGVTTAAPGISSSSSMVFAMGTSGFARLLLP